MVMVIMVMDTRTRTDMPHVTLTSNYVLPSYVNGILIKPGLCGNVGCACNLVRYHKTTSRKFGVKTFAMVVRWHSDGTPLDDNFMKS